MKRFYFWPIAVLVIAALSGCFLQNPFLHNLDGDAASLPPDQINDVSRSYADPFKFETVLPVDFELAVNLYDSVPGGKGPNALESLSPAAANIIVTLHDSTGNLIYKGRIQEDGTLSTLLALPSAPEDVVLTLQAGGFAERKVTIPDMRAYSEINRTMGMLAAGLSSKDLDESDTDGDGVPDNEDKFRTDPLRAFKVRIPATESFSIAFEDLFGSARTVDADYNDFIGHYHVFEILDAKNRVVEIGGHAEAVTKIAGFDHDFGLVIDSFYGQAQLKIHYYNTTGGQIGYEESTVKNHAQILLFLSTHHSVGRTTEFNLIFESPQLKKKKKAEEINEPKKVEETTNDLLKPVDKLLLLDIPPYNPYLYVRNVRKTGVYIHMIDELGLPNLTDEEDFRDDNGFPWALLIPVDWIHPEECQPIWIPYPRFPLWVESGGKLHTDWYKHNELPTDPVLEMAADINPGSGDSNPSFLFVFNDDLYFRANDGSTGNELWVYDGSSASRIADINSGSADGLHPTSPTEFFAVFNNELYFRANNGTNGYELWEYSGSGLPNQIPYEINPAGGSSFPFYPTVLGASLYFGAQDGTNGYELWEYDGTNAPTMVADINPSGNGLPYFLTVFDGLLYFQANNGTDGTELWKYDGVDPTSMVSNINPIGDSRPEFLTVFNNKLYFKADNGSNGFELWEYDGLNPPAMIVPEIFPGSGNGDPSYLTEFDGKLYFQANGGGSSGIELWAYDGFTAPAEVADMNPSGNSNPAYLCVFNNQLYFRADGGTNGAELWSYDGTNPPAEVEDINPSGDSSPAFLTLLNGKLYFQADDGSNGSELWVYDPGTP